MRACAAADSTAETSTSTTISAADRVRVDLGTLHRSRIREIPRLIALFYHSPGGWAVEDTTFDDGATWCRHAWYRYTVERVKGPRDFVVVYHPTKENPKCVPLGVDLRLHVTKRATEDGRTVFAGEYTGQKLHVERTVCECSLDDHDDVCGESSGLGAPTAPG
jgi:hypothetical protein